MSVRHFELGLATLTVALAGCADGGRGAEIEPSAVRPTAPAVPPPPSPAALVRARESLDLARQWSAAGSDPRAPLLDARTAYGEALGAAPNDPATLLEATYVEEWLGRVGERDVESRELDLLERYARSRGATHVVDVELDRMESDVFSGLGELAAAARAAKRGLASAPDDVALHQRLVDLHCKEGEVERLLAIEAELHDRFPQSATAAWYLGYVELIAGDVARRERRLDDAGERYTAARRDLASALAREPGFAEMTARIDHLAEVGRGWVAREKGDLDEAKRIVLARLAAAPELAALPDSLGRTLLDAAGTLGGDLEKRGDFAGGAELMEKVVAACPDDANQWNNLGYFRREQGSQVEARESHDAALPIFRESWRAYLEAAKRAPDDARIVNDTALIQVYHLHDELDRAEQLLKQAIATGERQLAELERQSKQEGLPIPESSRFPIAQAVGDAWLNLGYMHYFEFGGKQPDLPLARDCFVKSIATNSGPRGECQTYVDAIDGKREPVKPRAPGAFGAAGAARGAANSREVERGHVAWQRSLADGLEIATSEQRPLFVCSRGDGLTLGVPFLDATVSRKPFADALREWVCVVADAQRHTLVDCDGAGRRVLCPVFGSVTCGEHVQAAAEVRDAWLELRRRGEGEEPIEGFVLLGPDRKRLELERPQSGGFGPAAFDALRQKVGAPKPGVDLAPLVADLLWDEGPAQTAAAAKLVESPRARDVVEALLGLGDRAVLPIGGASDVVVPTSAVRALVAQLAGGELELLVSPRSDSFVAAIALEAWPDDAPLERVQHAAQWSDDPSLRRCAATLLQRRRHDERERRLLAAADLLR